MRFNILKRVIPGLFLLIAFLIPCVLPAKNHPAVIKKQYKFKISPRGTKTYKIDVPEGAKNIRAVVSEQTEMISLDIFGPTHHRLSHTSTWSHMSNWRKPLSASVSLTSNKMQCAGTWEVKITGAVHVNEVKNVRSITGVLTVYIETGETKVKNNKIIAAASAFPFKKEFKFRISPRGAKTYKIEVPEGAKKIRAVVSNQTEMISLDIFGPTHHRLSHTSTWSHMSNWRKPLSASASLTSNKMQCAGTWEVKVTGAVHVNEVKNVKNITGVLTIYVE